ncbi:Uncharacterised protein [Rhodococcus erythropolis]|nr:Uncharacterised protein [Rhodococcus erythropolis]
MKSDFIGQFGNLITVENEGQHLLIKVTAKARKLML